ncbi:sulfotransferase domain-containing protein [Pontibacter sp. G13]|uniref:sulfotransferase domain-containing protein n=1 Tax=Pontibacter sp. G13 TaxID=3074898 RepID=UPI00288BB689|nr:sulfotransferase domain-containing protein [Pontibacter sp. G13]WNJ16419.1 sulfotransferase domain-containing protein [Pontibacter sp. G13]
MLIISNGAYKSGSTWLFHILNHLTDGSAPPEPFRNPKWKKPSLKPGDSLNQFLASGIYEQTDILSKNHLSISDLQKCPPYLGANFKIFNITRDYRDVVVSAYFHAIREGLPYEHFWAYYWFQGRKLHKDVKEKNVAFAEILKAHPLDAVELSYEGLKKDFAKEVRMAAKILDIELSDDQISELQQATSFNSMRSKSDGESVVHGKQFFRKGVVGDFSKYYSKLMLRDFEGIENSSGGNWVNSVADALYPIRRLLLGIYFRVLTIRRRFFAKPANP